MDKKEKIDHIRFLINQTEEIMVDTKASIIVVFFAILLGSIENLQGVVTKYSISLVYSYSFIALLLLSFIFLVLTIRPITKWKFLLDIKLTCNKKEEISLWVENNYQAKNFKIEQIQDIEESYQEMLKNLLTRRVLKYKYYRFSMIFLRFALMSLANPLYIILTNTYY